MFGRKSQLLPWFGSLLMWFVRPTVALSYHLDPHMAISPPFTVESFAIRHELPGKNAVDNQKIYSICISLTNTNDYAIVSLYSYVHRLEEQ